MPSIHGGECVFLKNHQQRIEKHQFVKYTLNEEIRIRLKSLGSNSYKYGELKLGGPKETEISAAQLLLAAYIRFSHLNLLRVVFFISFVNILLET